MFQHGVEVRALFPALAVIGHGILEEGPDPLKMPDHLVRLQAGPQRHPLDQPPHKFPIRLLNGRTQLLDLIRQGPGRPQHGMFEHRLLPGIPLKISLPEQEVALDGLQRILPVQLRHMLFHIGLQIGKGALHTQQKQLVLAGVVVIHHPLGNPVVGADPLHIHLVVAIRPEFLQGCPVDLPPAVLLALLLCHGRPPPL